VVLTEQAVQHIRRQEVAMPKSDEEYAAAFGLRPADVFSSAAVVEYARRYKGGSLLVRAEHPPEIGKGLPLDEWIEVERRMGGRIYRRRVIVVEDWTEITDEQV
jgi:hypothetical protein